jgi:hypothetical protein
MDIHEQMKPETHALEEPIYQQLKAELASGLRIYWDTATAILDGSGIRLLEAVPSYFSLEKNLFSALFLYSYARGGIPAGRRILYVAINQCLRGMVTGCDNLLDDEYKPTLLTDLPEKGTRFRSVLDIMVSDRVLFEMLLSQGQENQIPFRQVQAVSRASLHCLARSGAQEASEEKGAGSLPAPAELLRTVHHFKTGILFQAPWAAPEILEKVPAELSARIKDALYHIGMGCQILDDMVDLEKDLRERRHNYVALLIFHGTELQERIEMEKKDAPRDLLCFPKARQEAALKVRDYLSYGLQGLFGEEHRSAPAYFFDSIVRRIGAQDYMRLADAERS